MIIDRYDISMIIVISILVTGSIFLFYPIFTYEEIVVEGVVVDYELKDNGVILLVFDNGERVKVLIPDRGTSDFTVNSVLIVTFIDCGFLFVEDDNVWSIKSIVKVPDTVEVKDK